MQLVWSDASLRTMLAPTGGLLRTMCRVLLTVGIATRAEGGGGCTRLGVREEGAGALEHELQLKQLAVTLLQPLAVGIHLHQLRLQLIQARLQAERISTNRMKGLIDFRTPLYFMKRHFTTFSLWKCEKAQAQVMLVCECGGMPNHNNTV